MPLEVNLRCFEAVGEAELSVWSDRSSCEERGVKPQESEMYLDQSLEEPNHT